MRTQWVLLATVEPTGWAVGIAATAASAALTAVPTRLLANPWFSRMTPTRAQDYLFLALSSLLIGATVSVQVRRRSVATSTVIGGFGTFVAVGCPVCNKLVVALVGVGGAMTWFAPLQPLIAVASLALLVGALRAGVRELASPNCHVAA